MSGRLSELSARARRGDLTEAEERQLRLFLASSLEARLAHRAGCQFDAEDSVLPGDEALSARVTERVLRGLEHLPAAKRRLGVKLAAAMALSVAAAAAAPTVIQRLANPSVMTTSDTHDLGQAPLASSVARARRPDSPPAASSTSSVAAICPGPWVRQPELAGRAPSPASSSTPVTGSTFVTSRREPRPSTARAPEVLFADASRARRQGSTSRAIALYRELQRRHPAAAESHAADIALGMLYSGQSPSLAVSHFSRYLQRGGPLAPEALWGQASALDALGRTKEARESWRALLARYPGSAYATAASAKLGSNP